MSALHIAAQTLGIMSTCISLMYVHTIILFIFGIFKTREFPETQVRHKYAVLIAARNEARVVDKLIDSIVNKQNYPKDLLTVFVVADNCTDKTAAISREHGAVCYERFDPEHARKGYALEFLIENIYRDYGKGCFEGFFIFDADNLLSPDYILRMNEAFDSGEKIITSVRLSKNLGANWIASSYAVHWLRTMRFEGRAMSFFRLASRIQGTGLLISADVLKDGWHFVSLTEDREFAADCVMRGYKITLQAAAEFYDEQPVSMKIALRQRLRWAKGHVIIAGSQGFKFLMKSISRRSLTTYAMFAIIVPQAFFTGAIALLRIVISTINAVISHQGIAVPELTILGVPIASDVYVQTDIFSRLDSYFGSGVASYIVIAAVSFCVYWVISMLWAAIVLILEKRRLQKISPLRLIQAVIMFPMFDIMGAVTIITALFAKVTWKPIPHTASISLESIERN